MPTAGGVGSAFGKEVAAGSISAAYIIGDSLQTAAGGAGAYLPATTPKGIKITSVGEVGQSINWAITQIEGKSQAERDQYGLYLITIGYNDTGMSPQEFKGKLDEIKNLVGANKKFAVGTYHWDAEKFNSVLGGYATIDLATSAKAHIGAAPHLTTDGYKERAKLEAEGIDVVAGGSAGSTSSSAGAAVGAAVGNALTYGTTTDFTEAGAKDPFGAYKRTFSKANIRANTSWNPPIPNTLGNDDTRARRNLVGWIAPDPMPLTGYDLTKAGTVPTSDDPKVTVDPTKDRMGYDAKDRKDRYGFRFLMNPTTVSESYSNTNGVDPISFLKTLQQMKAPILAKESGASMDLELFLTRVDDMHILRMDNWQDFYGPEKMTTEHREQLLSRGTMYDIEFLFRLVNVKRYPTWWSDIPTADWGIFLPRPVIVSIGDTASIFTDGTQAVGGAVGNQDVTPLSIRALISSMSFEHQVFSAGMVPVVTTVHLQLERLFDQMSQGVQWENVDGSDARTPVTVKVGESLSGSTMAIQGNAKVRVVQGGSGT